MNDLGADIARRFSQETWPVDIDGLGFRRLLFRLIDLEHGAIEDQRRFRLRNTTPHGSAIGDIEIAMLERQHLVLTPQTARQMATNQPGRAGDPYLHHRRL